MEKTDDTEQDESRGLLRERGDGDLSWWAIVASYTLLGAVLVGTYVWGFLILEDPSRLWGSLREANNRWLLCVYYGSILAAIIGYFASFAYVTQIAPVLTRRRWIPIAVFFNLFYISSCFWMPLCVSYIRDQRSSIYSCIRLNLLLSAFLVVGWASSVCLVSEEETPNVGAKLRLAGRLGTCWFAFHCAVLDACIWPPYFH
eukprot:TRINITY_DN46782_c0_g1_i1.p1 TRINITY_DN46782_c0_g1~~TRINITY_DN46782_c0_g1_i1.p1  ORF type:complete len:201 (+),score=10.20 TRINITY_DN46782_c0_g1_i1:161-763(+)